MKGLVKLKEVTLDTPFGAPSGPFIIGKLDGVECVFVPRHGYGHIHTPTEVNYRANVFGMKMLGVEFIIGVSAVGSLRENIVPGQVVLVDQFIDRTQHRQHTFFEKGCVGHVSMAHPVCGTLHDYLNETCKELGVTYHERGTYVNMEGPAFSTKAESELYRSWGAQVVGMTCLPEARLAREAEISYAVLAMATDYDCWHPDHDHVTVEAVVEVLRANVELSQNIVRRAVKRIAAHPGPCPQHEALKVAIMTADHALNPDTARALAPLIAKYKKIPPGPEEGRAESLAVFGLLALVGFMVASAAK
jgi:5'-methylthioadenosine phosphorylase